MKIKIRICLFFISFLLAQPDPYEGMCWDFNELTGGYSWVDCGDGGGFDIDIYGCTDPFATNFNPLATIDDNTCYYGWSIEACLETECGQMLQGAMNCEEILYYGVDCSECEECSSDIQIYGCTDPDADNYNSQARRLR